MTRHRRELVLTRQLPLHLQPRTHGGARPGAGRPRTPMSERHQVPHWKRPSHRKDDPVHVTLRVKRGLPSFRSELLQRRVKEALHRQRQHLADKELAHFQVVHFSIQDDHIHLIVEASDKRGVWRGVVGLEVRITRLINNALRRSGRLWGDRYHRHDLRTPSETRNALRYVLLNVQKHHRAHASQAIADAASSAPTFDGFIRPARASADPLRWPRIEPRTWLLRTGWRRRGPIDPTIAPTPSTSRLQ